MNLTFASETILPAGHVEDIPIYSLTRMWFLALDVKADILSPFVFVESNRAYINGEHYYASEEGYLAVKSIALDYASALGIPCYDAGYSMDPDFAKLLSRATFRLANKAYELVLENEGGSPPDDPGAPTASEAAAFTHTLAGVAAMQVGEMRGVGVIDSIGDDIVTLKDVKIYGSEHSVTEIGVPRGEFKGAVVGDYVQFYSPGFWLGDDPEFIFWAAYALSDLYAMVGSRQPYFMEMVKYARMIRERVMSAMPMHTSMLETFEGVVDSQVGDLLVLTDIRAPGSGEKVAIRHLMNTGERYEPGETIEFTEFADRVLGLWKIPPPKSTTQAA